MISVEEKKTLRENIERYEGRVNHMYLDSRAYVTVGVGHLLATVDAAQKLPFLNQSGQSVSAEEIAKEYTFLQTQPGNKLAKFYQPLTKLYLSDEAIDHLTDKHIESFYGELKRIYSDFDDFPSSVKLATFDLIFNLGMTQLKKKWPKFNACVAKKDWSAAADNCRRRGIADARNDYVKKLLMTASNTTIA